MFWILVLCLQVPYAQNNDTPQLRQNTSLNKNWKSHLGSATNPTKDFDYSIVRNFAIAAGGALLTKFDDSK
ncbi:hypothetical protein ACRASX_13650 [Flavobacterium sp. TMP13]|uniref:hypothetical protein n=1 Tax=Flavobacterium sp. TMP13 TaxID=3425950 RepID=UPI003D779066